MELIENFIREVHTFLPVDLEGREEFLQSLEGFAQKVAEQTRGEERKKWIKAVGEKIDKSTLDLMINAFNEGVAVTKDGYDRAFKTLTPPTPLPTNTDTN